MTSTASADTSPTPPMKKKDPKNPTWEYPKGSGIKIAEIKNKTGGKEFMVSYQVRIPGKLLGAPGKREMHQRSTKADAQKLAEDRFIALRKHGTEFSKIPVEVQKQAAMAWGILDEHNRTTRLNLNLIDVVRAGMKSLSPSGGLKTFSEVCEELRTSKAERLAAGGLAPVTAKDFKSRSTALEGHFGDTLVSQITVAEIIKALGVLRRTLSQRSVLNYRTTLAEIFSHAKARQYTPTNPMEHLTREDFKTLGGEQAVRNVDGINILSVDEARRLLEAAHQHSDSGMLGVTILRLFCGLRTAEAWRVDWREVHWLDAKPYVHIPASKAKKRRIRHVDIPANALAWLKLCNPPAKGNVAQGSPKGFTDRFARITRLAGIGKRNSSGEWETAWENNDTRHSFASYHYALHGDALKTAAQMGHAQSDDVLFAHYRSLVKKPEAEAYFSIMPETGAGKVEEFPRAAQEKGKRAKEA